MASDLTKQLNRIQKDILVVLYHHKVPLSQSELHTYSELKNLSEFGWSFALEKLERNHEVEFVSPNRWKLKNIEDKIYLTTIEETCSTKIQP